MSRAFIGHCERRRTLRLAACRFFLELPRHSQDRIHYKRANPNRDHVFPPDIHQLVISKSWKRTAEPDHDVDDHRDLEHEPEQSNDRRIDGWNQKRHAYQHAQDRGANERLLLHRVLQLLDQYEATGSRADEQQRREYCIEWELDPRDVGEWAQP